MPRASRTTTRAGNTRARNSTLQRIAKLGVYVESNIGNQITGSLVDVEQHPLTTIALRRATTPPTLGGSHDRGHRLALEGCIGTGTEAA